jgi:16S rRNA (uracil1498-N3)-methyltransferase
MREACQVPARLRVVLAETEQQEMLLDVMATADEAVLLAIGPEGGWTEDELDLFRKQGWISASLGPTILRAETAAIAATVLAVSVLNHRIASESIRERKSEA